MTKLIYFGLWPSRTSNFAISLLLLVNLHILQALKCFSGDPAFRNECTSLSYCLYIISRNGRTQWSCDGNAMSQVSLCSTLGLQQDVEEAASANFPTYVNQGREQMYRGQQTTDNKLVKTPYESSAISSNRFMSSSRSLSGGGTHESQRSRFGVSSLHGNLRCFNGGELGKICCCSNDFCNSAPTNLKLWPLFISLLFLLYRHLFR